MKPLVSVVITTKNEAKNIGRCIRSVKKQSYPQELIEIIVVDNNSTDRTVEIAKKYTELVFNRGPERSAQRNFGMINKSTGDYAMFIDADMILSPKLIAECVAKIKSDKKIIGLYIPLRWIGNNWIIKSRGFEREFYDNTCLDAVRFVRKKEFVAIGGFDDKLYAGEDWDLDRRIRNTGKVDFVKAKLFHMEDENINLKEIIGKVNYYSDNLSIYVKKWGENDKEIKKQLGFFYRLFVVFFEKKKYKKLLRHPIISVKMYFLKFIMGVYYLKRR